MCTQGVSEITHSFTTPYSLCRDSLYRRLYSELIRKTKHNLINKLNIFWCWKTWICLDITSINKHKKYYYFHSLATCLLPILEQETRRRRLRRAALAARRRQIGSEKMRSVLGLYISIYKRCIHSFIPYCVWVFWWKVCCTPTITLSPVQMYCLCLNTRREKHVSNGKF